MTRQGWLYLVGVLFALPIVAGPLPPPASQEPTRDQRLIRILERTKEYCLKLERAALDFTCIEKIEERAYSLRDDAPDSVVPNVSASGVGGVVYAYKSTRMPYYANTYVYDYQFVRKGGQKTESRILVEENGRKKRVRDAGLTTSAVRVENALFGPIGLLGADVQNLHDYRIIGEETEKGEKVVIVEAVPKPSLERPHCFGRVWIREDDASIMKIAWDQTSVGNFRMIQQTAKSMGAEPRLTSETEYGREKNGLWFPSKDITEEAYLKHGKIIVKSLTTILYKDYKFFTVETEVKY